MRRDTLEISTLEDALVVPTRKRTVYRDIDGAVFDAALDPVPQALLTRTWRRGQITAPPAVDEIDLTTVEEVEEPHLYGGYFFDHFGHFLLESLARTWAVRNLGPLPIVWCAGDPPNQWQKEILQVAGLESRLVSPQRPTRFRRLLVPEPGFRIQGKFHRPHVGHLARFRTPSRARGLREGLAVPQQGRVGATIARRRPARGGAGRSRAAGLVPSGMHPARSAGDTADRRARRLGLPCRGAPGAAQIANYAAIAEAKGIIEMDLFGAFSIDDGDCRELAHPEVTAGEVDALVNEALAAGDDAEKLRALKAGAEAKFDYGTWLRRQRWRIPPRARMWIRLLSKRHPRLLERAMPVSSRDDRVQCGSSGFPYLSHGCKRQFKIIRHSGRRWTG